MDGKRLKKYYFVFILGLFFFLRLPSLFEPFTYGDEGIYLTLGQALRKGLILYKDIHDNKPPALYLLAALAGSFSQFRIILFVWSLATILVFFKLAQVLFPKNKNAVLLTTFIFTLISSSHTFEANIANAENFMMLPVLIAFWFTLQKKAYFLAGLLIGLAALFKIPAAFDLLPLLLMANLFNQWLLILTGFISPILLTVFYFQYHHALSFYLKAAFSQNIPYLSSWSGNSTWPLLIRASLLGLLVIGLIIFRKRVSLAIKVILLWFGFSLFAALLSGRPYPHYLIQVLPAFSLSFGFFYFQKRFKLIFWSLLSILMAAWIIFRFWYYPNLPYLANFYQFLIGARTKQAYFTKFDNKAEAIYQTAKFIQTHTQPTEKIFIWGTQPSIYALSHRLPAGRYTTSYHISDFNGYQETLIALEKEKPVFIIITNEEKRPFPDLDILIKENYRLIKQIGQFQIMIKLKKDEAIRSNF